MDAVEKFQNGEANFLLATDLLSWGLDIFFVEAVINYNYPNEDSWYIHWIGWTARAGLSGTAITLVNDEEKLLVKKVVRKNK